MQDGRITRFLNRCLRLDQCFYCEVNHRFVFNLYEGLEAKQEALFVYPQERRIWFLATFEVYRGEIPDGTGFGSFDDYDYVPVESVDKKNLSSQEAAKMLYGLFTKHDLDHVVSKRSLRLLR